MKINEYLESLPTKKKLSDVKLKILIRLWGDHRHEFPKPWVSSAELLELTGQKYFDRRTRELRDQLGCDLESAYCKEFAGHGWRLASSNLTISQDREYLTPAQKIKLFENHDYRCVICGTQIPAGVRGLQADHKVPLSRGGGNDSTNWHPMCNNCNVGKRRACQGCTLNCATCSWAFPETVGIQIILNLREETLRRIIATALPPAKPATPSWKNQPTITLMTKPKVADDWT
jgi:5-methylcytosine-specific restriction endonuclease McrA